MRSSYENIKKSRIYYIAIVHRHDWNAFVIFAGNFFMDILKTGISFSFVCAHYEIDLENKSDTSIFFDKFKFYEFIKKTNDICTQIKDAKEMFNLLKSIDCIRNISHHYATDRNELSERLFIIENFISLHLDKIKRQESIKGGAEYHKRIVDDFEVLFPNYIFIKSEKKCGDGRVDIYAKEKATNRDILMEVKSGAQIGSTQLNRYKHFFNNPILIHISHYLVKTKQKGIIYIKI